MCVRARACVCVCVCVRGTRGGSYLSEPEPDDAQVSRTRWLPIHSAAQPPSVNSAPRQNPLARPYLQSDRDLSISGMHIQSRQHLPVRVGDSTDGDAPKDLSQREERHDETDYLPPECQCKERIPS